MDRGIYSASSGGLLSARKLDITANNLANVNTVGFKAERLTSRQQEFADTLASRTPVAERDRLNFNQVPGVVQISSTTDFTPGPVSNTGNPLNVALAKQNEFFMVAAESGEELLTRAGNFTVDPEGNLTTADGRPVLGDGGPLVLPPGAARISNNGAVIVNNQVIGRLRVVEVDELNRLERVEGVRFRLNGAAANPVPTNVIPESLEMANVGVVDSMVDMISVNKAFEAYTKTVRTLDELNDRAIRTARISG